MEEKKYWYESRTMWLALLQGVAALFAVISTSPEFQSVGWILLAKSVVDVWLRNLTDTKLG